MNGEQTNITLIHRIQNKTDQLSWEEFSDIYAPFIHSILHYFNIPHHQIDDLCQDIFLKIWKNIEYFEYTPEKCLFRSWLSTVTRNKIRDFREKRREIVGTDNLPEIATAPEVEETIDREWKLFIARKALEKVSKKFDSHVFQAYLHFQEGIKVEEIAREFGIAEGSVYVYNKRVQAEVSRQVILLSNYLG